MSHPHGKVGLYLARRPARDLYQVLVFGQHLRSEEPRTPANTFDAPTQAARPRGSILHKVLAADEAVGRGEEIGIPVHTLSCVGSSAP